MKVEDEHGTPWVVAPGDPARSHINRLNRLGYRYTVLPSLVLCGIIDGSAEQPLPSQVLLPPDLGAMPTQGLLRLIRLRECVEVLRG